MKSSALMPGDFAVIEKQGVLSTLLGSCVAMVFWHPQLKIGAMSHFVLPNRGKQQGRITTKSGRYADEFFMLLLTEIESRKTSPSDYVVHAYGAANMFPQLKVSCSSDYVMNRQLCFGCVNVACRNRQAVFNETTKYGFILGHSDLGGSGYRHITFDVASGHIEVRKMQTSTIADGRH